MNLKGYCPPHRISRSSTSTFQKYFSCKERSKVCMAMKYPNNSERVENLAEVIELFPEKENPRNTVLWTCQ